ncbi:hypothetical protein JTF08_11265 [Micrococcaceae bacterium RIT802]|nr:hypothetical protein [Micrococcaceae bacterium RIT 802]
MTGRRRTPLQRAESRHAAEPDQDTDEFRNMMRRRQDAEEKLKRHLEGERDGRPIPVEETPEHDSGSAPPAAGGSEASGDTKPGQSKDADE